MLWLQCGRGCRRAPLRASNDAAAPCRHPPVHREMGYPIYSFEDGAGPCAGPPDAAPAPAPEAAAPDAAVPPATDAVPAEEPPAPVIPMRSFAGWVAGLGEDSWGAAAFTAAILSGGRVCAAGSARDVCAQGWINARAVRVLHCITPSELRATAPPAPPPLQPWEAPPWPGRLCLMPSPTCAAAGAPLLEAAPFSAGSVGPIVDHSSFCSRDDACSLGCDSWRS